MKRDTLTSCLGSGKNPLRCPITNESSSTFNRKHLGLTNPLAPCSRGFHKNFTFLPGSGNHDGYEPQLDADDPPIHSLCTGGHEIEGDRFLDRKTQFIGEAH